MKIVWDGMVGYYLAAAPALNTDDDDALSFAVGVGRPRQDDSIDRLTIRILSGSGSVARLPFTSLGVSTS